MALFPCDVCKRRYVGAGNSAYIGWMAGSYSERVRFRLCPLHIKGLAELCELTMICVQVGDQLVGEETALPRDCGRCELEPATVTYFANLYSRLEEPHVYAAVRCAKCAEPMTQSLSVEAIQARGATQKAENGSR